MTAGDGAGYGPSPRSRPPDAYARTVQDVLPAPSTEFGRRVRSRLSDEYVAWLTTTGRDGTPHPNPVWFYWDEAAELLVYTRPDAHRLRHVARTGRATLHLNGDSSGGDIIVVSGQVDIAGERPAAHDHSGYRLKYEAGMKRVSGSPEAFSATYSIPLVIHIERVRGF